jgi:hypothetical protein
MREVFRKLMQGTDGMLPAVVVSYDRESNTAEVRPTIALLTTSGEVVPRASVARVPVLALGGVEQTKEQVRAAMKYVPDDLVQHITASGTPLAQVGHIHLAADHPEGYEIGRAHV